MYFTVVALLFLVLFPVIYWYYIVYVKYRSIRQLPGPKPLPLIGNRITNSSVGIIKDMQKLYDAYKPRFVVYVGPQVRVIHSKSEHIGYVLNSIAHTVKSENFDVLKAWIGTGLATSNGDKWKERRKILNQSFNMNLFERFLKGFNRATEVLVKEFENVVNQESVDLMDLTNFHSLDIACDNLMGYRLNLKEKLTRDYLQEVKILLRLVGVRFFSFWARYETLFLWFSRDKKQYQDYLRDVKNFTIKVVDDRCKTYKEEKKHPENSDDFGIKKKAALMDILLEKEEMGYLSHEDVIEEIDTFMVAGYETSAGLIAFALYELARNPDVQRNLYQEVMNVAPTGEITIDKLNDLEYTEMVVKEALRKYPQVPFMERQIVEEFELDGIFYPKDTIFGIPIISMHYDPDYFENPNQFDPTRFAPENVDKIPKYAFLPFSAGPRICIGYKYAIWSAKTALAMIVREYEFFPVPGFEIELEFQITLKSTTGIKTRVEKRNNN